MAGVPVKLPDNAGPDQYYQAICSLLTSTDLHIKDVVKHMVKDVEGLNSAKIEERLRVVIAVLTWNLCLLRTDDPNDGTSQDIVKVNHKQLLSLVWKENKDLEAMKEQFITEADSTNPAVQPMCKAHHSCLSSEKKLSKINLNIFNEHHRLISVLDFSSNKLEELPNEFFSSFLVIQSLNLSKNKLTMLPLGIGTCNKLGTLHLSNNRLKCLPDDLKDISASLKILTLSDNPLFGISAVSSLESLEELHVAGVGLTELPSDFGKLTNLVILKLGENELSSLPASFENLTKLTDLDLSGIKWIDSQDTKMLLTREAFGEFTTDRPHFAQVSTADLFSKFDTKSLGTLDYHATQLLNVEIFKMFKRLGQATKDTPDEYFGVPREIFTLKNLRCLNLSFQGLTRLSEHVKELTCLEQLILINNPSLETLPAEIGSLVYLKEMPLRGCQLLKTPPKEIVRRGFSAIFGYLKRLQMGAVECKRTKLMLVGLGGAGKTSLVDSLTCGATVSSSSVGAKITDGIDITSWTVKHSEENLTFSVWDFAGQTVYYNTHQFFMSNRAVYLLLWNIRLGYEHAGLDFWLSSIACHAPKAPILVIGSHKDQVQNYWFPETAMKKRYPQIRGFHAISSLNGEGVQDLRKQLGEVALKEKYMGEKIPEVWLNFERGMLKERFHSSTLTWEKVEECALDSGIVEKAEVSQAVQFLHDLGSVQHFQNEYLRSRVVINPQWIVDAMSCIVSVQNTPIKEGRFFHADLGVIWAKYPEDTRLWLLRLTEEFDLTFPSKDEKANIVPCLLPAEEPAYTWPESGSVVGVKELKIIYRFDHLPAGLFNRVQVRLYQFSDSSIIWKSGSLLNKNGHMALLTTADSSDVIVKVQGPRPENILFMIHEVFEALISESFHGVQYDYFVPCSDCTKVKAFDPCMFAATKIRRATELKAPFLQCDMYFHTISLAELHARMPPDNSSDFDVHLERNLLDLNNLRKDMTYDAFFVYSPDNIPGVGEEEKMIAPRRIFSDLQLSGFKVWFSVDPMSVSIEQVALTMREAKVVVFCLSGEFVIDERCRKLFQLATVSMQKSIQVIMLGDGLKFLQTSDIGIQVSTEVYINMTNTSVHRYPSKIIELTSAIKNKVAASQVILILNVNFYCT